MSKWYFQIKGRNHPDDSLSFGRWSWPPLFSGQVEADTRKDARKQINDLFAEQFPCRVAKDDDAQPFLLHIVEMTKKDAYLLALFDTRECQECGRHFRRIDLYNDTHEPYKGTEYCSQACKDKAYALQKMLSEDDPYGKKSIPCIYRITNKLTGMVYIGQTKQAFTLRWWQHVKWGSSDCKFHQAIKESEITDWTFEVVEVCSEDKLDQREAYHIAAHDSVFNGYNTAMPNAEAMEEER